MKVGLSTKRDVRLDHPKYGVDFDKIFSPMVKMTTLRFMLGVVAADNLELIQLHVRTTFLHDDL